MGLFKPVKKVQIKAATAAGAEISPLRPRYVPKKPPCIDSCPCGNDIRGMLTTLAQAEDYGRNSEESLELAWRTMTKTTPFPAVCGRVCPHPCEDGCNRQEKDGSVAINAMERYVGDFGIDKKLAHEKLTDENRSEKIAVIGAGPAGLSCAYQLARRGYQVTVFEAFSKPGGMLRYGIPAYRLPREVLDAEIGKILDLGVDLRCGVVIGRDKSLDDLRSEYKAIFVGIGAHKGRNLRVPGEDASNVFTGTEFLNRVNSGESVEIGDKVVVIGGGDTAIDAARLSKRLGADVTIVYRRTRDEMPAIDPEIEGALEEGIKIEFLAAPVEILTESGKAVAMKCLRMKLGEVDSSGRRRPVPIEGSEFEVPVTAVIAAISQAPDFTGFDNLHDGKNWVKTDDNGATGEEGVYSGGDDIELGLVTIAIGQGRFAAEAIDARMRCVELNRPDELPKISVDHMKLEYYEKAEPHVRTELPVDKRGFDTEIQQGLSDEDALAESKRCMSCGMCMDCESCWMYCTNSCFERLPKGEHYKVKLELCNGCKKCAEECPCGYIEMV